MSPTAVLAFDLIKKIDDDFKRSSESPHDFARMILQRYGIRVNFVQTPLGLVTAIDYSDIIELFENRILPMSANEHQAHGIWQDG